MIELRAGRLRCELQPEAGGGLAGLWRDQERVLAAVPLVPFSNRVAQASVEWQGTEQPLFRHSGDPLQAITGIAASRAWEVLDSDAASAMLAYEHRTDAAWPFAFDCSHTVRLEATRLDLTLAMTNQSGRPAPAGLGWRLRFPGTSARHVALRASGRRQFDADLLPAGLLPASGLDADCAGLAIDAAFEGWDGVAELAGNGATLRITSPLTRILACAAAGEDALVLAPVTHAPNAVHLHAMGLSREDLGLHILQPGETLVAQVTIELTG